MNHEKKITILVAGLISTTQISALANSKSPQNSDALSPPSVGFFSLESQHANYFKLHSEEVAVSFDRIAYLFCDTDIDSVDTGSNPNF